MLDNALHPLLTQPVIWLCLPLALIAAILMGFTRSAFGAGGFVVSPLMVLALGGADGLAVVAPLMLFAGCVSCAQHRKGTKRSILIPLLSSAMAGTAIGGLILWALLRSGEEAVVHRNLELVVGGLSLVYVLLVSLRSHIKAKAPHDPRSLPLFLAGSGVSLSQTVANSGSPILTVFFNYHGWPKEKFVASQAWFLQAQNLAKLVPFIALGVLHMGNFGTSILLLPLVILGNWMGKIAFGKFTEQTFFRAFIIMLVVGFIASALLIIGRGKLLGWL